MKKQVVQNILGLTITLSLLHITSVWARQAATDAAVHVAECSGGYTLSVNANNVALEKILKELGEKCSIKTVIYENALLSRPISVSFKNVSIEEGIKKVIKAADITNHLITYRKNGKNRSVVSELALLGNSGKAEEIALTRETMIIETGKEGTAPVFSDVPPEDTIRKRVEAFKARYEWEDTETRELADYLLTLMPDSVKGSGLGDLTKALDSRMEEGDEDTVDEELFYQAIGDTVPPHIAPFMMESIKHYSRRGETDTPDGSPNQLYRDFMGTNRSKGGDY